MDCYSDWSTIIPMGRNITTSYLNAGLRELLSTTAIPGRREDHNSPQENSNHWLVSGAFTIRPQHHTILRAMARQRQQLSQKENNYGSMEWQMYKRGEVM